VGTVPIIVATPYGRLRRAIQDSETRWLLQCPGCQGWGPLDDDQLHGRVSVNHDSQGCAGHYHETHDFAAAIIAERGEL
jgi:hypothetical protein